MLNKDRGSLDAFMLDDRMDCCSDNPSCTLENECCDCFLLSIFLLFLTLPTVAAKFVSSFGLIEEEFKACTNDKPSECKAEFGIRV